MFYWIANILICYCCVLHVKNTVSYFILEVTNDISTPSLSYVIGLVSTIGFKIVFVFKSWYHSIYIYNNNVYLSGLPNFITMHLFYMYFHTYAFYQVLYTIKFIILTAHYGISQQSSILHILFNYHSKILVLKIGWSFINCKDFTCIGKAFGLTVYRLLISRCDQIT